ncbi:MAG: hypothetical protein JO038_02115 [Alphaproteobacteria bacterium]|nr:hypothetical protein [Alphaproteobacteria bacterium]
MGRSVVVSSNCQTGGLGACFQALMPQDDITAIPMITNPGQDATGLIEALCRADIWIALDYQDFLTTHAITNRNDRLQCIAIPSIDFGAFHPDLCYAGNASTNTLTLPHYNSAIGVWAYKNCIEPSDAVRLYNAASFRDLGYLDCWNSTATELRQAFVRAELPFDKFFLPVKRSGVFMYSTNHPKISALAALAKIVMRRIGEGDMIFDKPVEVSDALAGDVLWPIYPEVAEGLALPGGCYEWTFPGRTYLSGIEAYLEWSYQNYETQGIRPSDIYFNKNLDRYHSVLGPQVGV